MEQVDFSCSKRLIERLEKLKSVGTRSGLCSRYCNTSDAISSNHRSPGLCGCHTVMEDDDIKTELSQLLSSYSFYYSGQHVAAKVINWLHALDADFFSKSFDTVVSCRNKCLNRGNDYTEK
jgi:hypothetical protein